MGGAREALSRRSVPATVRVRRALLLGLVLFALATAAPGIPGSRRARRDPQLDDGGPVPFVAT